MRTILSSILVLAACSAPTTPNSGPPGGGGKGDCDTCSIDGGVDAATRTFSGTCTVTTTQFVNGFGTPDTSSAPISLDVRLDHIAPDGTVTGTVHVPSPWGSIPDDLWRGWCHLAHVDGEPLTNACAIGPYDIATTALGFGDGWVIFRDDLSDAGSGFTFYFNAGVDIGRDSINDGDYTRVRYSCWLY
jgi:hypothetical protein